MANKNMHKAKVAKNDEFYTQLTDIEKELQYYITHFKDAIIYCNCDGENSNFVKYFKNNGEKLGIKKLLYSSCDFRSDESIEMLKEANIVVTNPPFSLFREFISLLAEYNKKFLIIGNLNAITYKDCFKLIKENRMWLGVNNVKEFIKPDGEKQKFGNVCWFTNLNHTKRNEEITLFKTYNENKYPKYDNYNAINVDKVKEIPKDYEGVMGVPITFLDKYNPEQFEILDCNDIRNENMRLKEYGIIKDKDSAINGKPIYARIVIKNRKPEITKI